MMMFFTSSILIGFMRLCLIILFLFYLNRKFINKEKQVHFLDFIVTNWLRYGALLIVLIFCLVQLSAYNTFNCYFLLSLFVLLDSIGIQNLKNPKGFIKQAFKKANINLIKAVENRKSLRYFLSIIPKDKNVRFENRILFWTVIIIGATTFLSRYFFVIYDNYSLSDSWINDLNSVLQFDNQYWATQDLRTNGELSLVNFYSKITDVSPAIALQVIALLESVILAVVMFWVIHKMTLSKYFAPLITALFFGLVYVLSPLNVYFVLKGNPTFLALAFALPLFAMYANSSLFKGNKKSYFIMYAVGFVAIGLTDLFTYCILIPPFLLIAGVLTTVSQWKKSMLVLAAFIVASFVLFVVYKLACQYQGIDWIAYLESNLISISSYTYVPQLVYPYATILYWVQVSSMIALGLLLLFVVIKKGEWRTPLTFISYFNFLILLSNFHLKFVDKDLLSNAMIVFLPLIIGFNLAILQTVFQSFWKTSNKGIVICMPLTYMLAIFLAFHFQKEKLSELEISDDTPKYILNAYDHIASNYFEQTYCIVNDPATQVLSTNSHYFMNYDYFLNEYPKIDSIQHQYRNNPEFFRTHPEYAVAKSILVFVLTESSMVEKNVFAENKHYQNKLVKSLKSLRQKGRPINLIYTSKILNVYEILNEPKKSKVKDLLF